ncbi:MAG: SUMF1/EgtB/PvdO family nonheme iron enzyme [Saprospiraceae bacterium]
MKYMLSIFALLIGTLGVFGEHDNAPKPEKIHFITEIQKAPEYYAIQRGLWAEVLEKEPKNGDAWFNYYLSSRYARMFKSAENVDLKQLAKDVWDAIPNSFEAHFIQSWTIGWTDEAEEHLENAYKAAPDRYETYRDMARNALLKGNKGEAKKFTDKLLESGKASKALLAWNYNLLQSVEEDAILITYGDNDTYPLWSLQLSKRVQPNVKVLNIHLLSIRDYNKSVFSELGLPVFTDWCENPEILQTSLVEHITKHSKRPVHISITTRPETRKTVKDNLYLTGLTYKYAPKNFGNIAQIKNNFEQKFLMDYIKVKLGKDISQGIVDELNMSYVPSLMLLYKHYKESENSSKAAETKALILQIGEDADRLSTVKKYFTTTNSDIRTYPKLNIKKIEKQFEKVGEALWASSSELSIQEYDLFLMDLVKNRDYDQLTISKTEKTDWIALLPAEYQQLSKDVIFKNGHPDDANMPIQNISHEAAIAYCDWLTKVYNNSNYRKKKFQHVIFRLPTEQEWTKAARAGHDETPYPWGGAYARNIKGCYLANFNVTKEDDSCKEKLTANDGGFFTVAIASYFPNDLDCYNMSGNVAEMVQQKGIAKGGSWEDTPNDCQIGSTKNYTKPSPAVGFRVFMEVVQYKNK